MVSFAIALYLVMVAALAAMAYRKYHRRWKRRERARMVMGVALVIFPAMPLAVVIPTTLLYWAVVVAGFGLAGAITLYMDIQTETGQADSVRREVFGND